MNPNFSIGFGRCLCLLAVICLLTISSLLAQKPVPELWGLRIHDEAKVLTQGTIDGLELKLKAYEDSTTNQVAVLIVRSLDGESIETYALRVVEKWQLGTKKNDNGVLLLMAVDDHKMRIEVGNGLEGMLTDAKSSRIIRDEIAPHLRRGDFDSGVTAAVDAIVGTIAGEYHAEGTAVGGEKLSVLELIFTGIFIFGILGLFTAMAVFSGGCAGWGLYLFLLPFYAIFPGVVLGLNGGIVLLVVYAVLVPITKIWIARSAWGKSKMMKWQSRGGGSGGGWSLGSGWGSSGGFSSGSSSSFSGGGGSFGGGGSSGSW